MASPLDDLPPPGAVANPLDALPPPTIQAPAPYSPVEGNSFLENAAIGAGAKYTDLYQGLRQRLGLATPEEVAEKRATDAPIGQTWGGTLGGMAALAPVMFAPGINAGVGAAALTGGALGALQPTTGNESALLNTGLNAGLGAAGQFGGNVLGNWLKNRAAAPFLGWSQSSGNRAVASGVGSSAARLDQPALRDANADLGAVFSAARSPNVTATFDSGTAQAVTQASAKLNPSSAQAFGSNPAVTDLMSHLRNGSATAEQLGSISSDLGSSARAQMTTQMGDRALGKALFGLKEHVDDVVGSTITDPNLANAYQAARPQWRLFSTLESRPALLNSATGDVNLTALGKYLQRTDKAGYTRGGNTSAAYNAARWGQETGLPKGAPPFDIGSNLGISWMAYHAMNNPVTGAIGGVVSRAGAPAAPLLPGGLAGLAVGAEPIALSYLEQ